MKNEITPTNKALAPQKSLYSIPPHNSPLIKMHLWHAPALQTVNCFRQDFARSFVFDFLERVEVCLECEDEGAGFRETVESLPFGAEVGLS